MDQQHEAPYIKICQRDGKGGSGGKKGKSYMYEWPMDMDNGVGIDCGSEGWAGWRRANGENWGNYDRINENKKKEKIKHNKIKYDNFQQKIFLSLRKINRKWPCTEGLPPQDSQDWET